jgi:DNA-binding CsgD family transcriptional regulator
VNSNIDLDVWKEFEIRFNQVQHDFYSKLSSKFPDLSANEKRLCAFLKLNISTREISALTGQSQKSIDIARNRLRKKLNLTNVNMTLNDFFAKL